MLPSSEIKSVLSWKSNLVGKYRLKMAELLEGPLPEHRPKHSNGQKIEGIEIRNASERSGNDELYLRNFVEVIGLSDNELFVKLRLFK